MLQKLATGMPVDGVFHVLLESWKKEHCEALGHPLELVDGYMTTCVCGERFGAVTPEQAGEQDDG